MVPPFWVFPGWHFVHSDRNGPVALVNVVNGSVEQSPVGTTLGVAVGQLSSRPITDDALFHLFVSVVNGNRNISSANV